MGPVISVFVMVLVIAILSGLTFLFVSQLKTNAMDTSTKATFTEVNESGWLNNSGYPLARRGEPSFTSPSITFIANASNGSIMESGKYTLTGNRLTNATATVYNPVVITYTYSAIDGDSRNAYKSINSTESAGLTVVNYISLIFLAVIFGALLTLVLRIILPYINLGKNIGGF